MFNIKIQTSSYVRSKRGRKSRKRQRTCQYPINPTVRQSLATSINDNDMPPKTTAA